MKSDNKNGFDVLVIGGGASGLMAAITAASYGAKTAILEHKDRVGKKILATGNGKCNYTNELQGISYYRGEDPAFVLPIMEQFGFVETVSYFKNIGIAPKNKNGYYYPASEQAASVLEVLRMEADYQKVQIYTECDLKAVKQTKNGFEIHTNQDIFLTKTLIWATGLLASPKTGSDGSAIPHIEKMGHHFADVVPALVALQGKQAFFKQLAGIRAEIFIKLLVDGKQITTENGELQLTDYGISGIPVFQISRYATKALKHGHKVTAILDFMPNSSKEELKHQFEERFKKNAHGKDASEAMIGLFNKKLNDVLLKEAGIDLHQKASDISERQYMFLIDKCKELRIDITGSKTYEQAQVCAGGVLTREIEQDSMESKIIQNVYFSGEVVDIDGICGGYNLQWAWSSGYVAGKHAALRAKEMEKA